MQQSDKGVIESAFHILMDEIHGNAADHGFWEKAPDGRVLVDLRNKGEMIALMHQELSELLEATRATIKAGSDLSCYTTIDGKHYLKDTHCPEFTSEEIECADVLIRLFDYAKAFNLRLAEAVWAKHHFNVSRPFKHEKRF